MQRQPVVAITIRFNDAIVVGRALAVLLRAAELPAAELIALRRAYDAIAATGAADWTHDGLQRHVD